MNTASSRNGTIPIDHPDLSRLITGTGEMADLIRSVDGGTVRFAEFFTFRDSVIDTLNLHYDGQDYIAKGGR